MLRCGVDDGTWVGFALNLDLIRLHDFLDGSSNIAQSDVNSCLLDTSVGGILDSSQQVVVNRVESKRECRVDDSSYKPNVKKKSKKNVTV